MALQQLRSLAPGCGRNCDLKMVTNSQIITICGRPEAGGDVMSSHDLNSVQCCCQLVNLEFTSSSSLQENRKQHNSLGRRRKTTTAALSKVSFKYRLLLVSKPFYERQCRAGHELFCQSFFSEVGSQILSEVCK